MERLESRQVLAAGDPDSTFGIGGLTTTDFFSSSTTNENAYALAIQADGKILVAGEGGVLARYSSAGVLDTTFGEGGRAVFGGTANGIVVQSDGKIVVAGSISNGNDDFAVARYNSDGTPDTTFSGDGKQTTSFGSGVDVGQGVALQSDGKIVVAGYAVMGANGFDFAVARYNADGSLDSSFGSGGKVTTAIGAAEDQGHAVVIQSDGKIVVVGSAKVGTTLQFALTRYTTNGNLDTATYGAGTGKVTTLVGTVNSEAYGAALQSDGKIVVVGYAKTGGRSDFALARYKTDGTLDTFGTGGKQTTSFTRNSVGRTVAIQSDGKIVVAGYVSNSSDDDFAVARYSTAGALDTTFDVDGMLATTFDNFNESAWGVALQSDGQIVVAGIAENGNDSDFALARYNKTNGSLDSSFGNGGKVIGKFGSSDNFGQSVAIDSLGRTYVAGYSFNGSNDDFALTRYTTSGALDTSFGNGGRVITAVGVGNDRAYGVALDSVGRVYVAGATQAGSTYDFALARFTTAGLLDSSFGASGKVITSVGAGSDFAYGVALDGSGRVYVAGSTYDDVLAENFAVARYTTGGILDSTFGSGGKAITDFGATSDIGYAIALDSSERVYVAGYVAPGDFGLVRYTTSGVPDSTFGTNGKVVADFSNGSDVGYGVAVDSSGRAYVSGNTLSGGNRDFALARFTATGTPDSAFGVGGKVTTDFGANGDFGYGVVLDSSGRAYVVGTTSNSDFALARYTTSGVLDSVFGASGKVTTDFAIDAGSGRAVALDSSGKIYVAGYIPNGANYDFALARYEGGPSGSLSASLAAGNLTIADIDATGKNNRLTVSADGTGNLVITDTNEQFSSAPAEGALSNGNKTLTISKALVTGKLVFSTGGGTDELTVNYGGLGGFFSTAIDFHGGNNSGDKLIVSGGTFATVTETFTTSGPGNSGNLLYDTGSVTATITYDGLSPIDMAGSLVANLVFNLPAGGTAAVLEDDGIPSNGISQIRNVSGSTFETTTFANPTGTLTVRRGSTTDSVTINSLPDFSANLAIGAAGSEFSTINLAGNVTLATGKTIAASASILNATAAAAFTVSGGGAINLAADSIAINSNATLAAGSGVVSIVTVTTGWPIDLGADTAGTLGLNNTELDRITGGTLNIGDANSGIISLRSPITRAAATTIGLTTGGNNGIAFIGSGSLDANGGDITLATRAAGSGGITSGTATIDVKANVLNLISGSGGTGLGSNPLSFDANTINSATAGTDHHLHELNSVTIGPSGLNGGTYIDLRNGTFVLGGANRIGDSSFLALSSAIFQLNGYDETVRALPSEDGAILNGSATPAKLTLADTGLGYYIKATIGGATANDNNLSIVNQGGSVDIYGNNTFTGTFTIGGVVRLLNANALGAITGGTTVASGGVLDLNGQALAAEPLTISGSGAFGYSALNNGSANAASHSGPITLAGSASLGGSGELTVSGKIDDGTSTFSLTKAGAGTLTLTNSNNYNGSTFVNAGKLVLNGSVTSNVIVNSPGELNGDGTVTGNVAGNGVFSPGSGVGKMTINGDFTPSGTVNFTVNSAWTTAGTDFDQYVVTGAVNLTGSALTFANTADNSAPAANSVLKLIDNDTTSDSTTPASAPANSTTFGIGSRSFTLLYNGGDGNDVVLNFDSAAPTITSTTPSLVAGTLAVGASSFQVNFGENVVGAGTPANYELRSLGVDSLLGTTDDTIIAASVSYSGTVATLIFAALPESVYRLTVKSTITDTSGNPLDGDANGMAGDDWRRDFVVTATGSKDGRTPATAGYSALQILKDGYSVGDGIYWLDPDGTGPNPPFQAYADMTRDGGGWTLGLKTWYQAGHYRNPNAVGNVTDGLTLKGNPYKLSDESIRQLIGVTNNFDVLVDQAGFNSAYSTGNYEYAVLRNYTGAWTWEQAMPASTTQTLLQSYRIADNALAWSGELQFGAGGAGINGSVVLRGPGMLFNMGTQTNSAWHHFYMAESNSDTYLYLSNGAQHSSGFNMNHRYWFRETTARDTSIALVSSSGYSFDIDPSNFGAGQLIQGPNNAFDGLNRLLVNGVGFGQALSAAPVLEDNGRTLHTASQHLSSLTISREITVPSAGSEDFVRTVEILTNPTGSNIITPVTLVGNLGSDAATAVFVTSDGDLLVEPTDLWFGTDDGDGTGTPAIIHYLRGPNGLIPTNVAVIGDNIEWTYNLTVPAGQTQRLASFTVLGTTRAQAIAAAGALTTATGFSAHAADFLTTAELTSLANFQFSMADLEIAKDDGVTSITPGVSNTYTITVTNHGPSTVSNLTVTDSVPAALLSPVFTPSVGSYDSGTGAWTGLNLASGQSITLTLSGTINASATGNLVNTATVAVPADFTDPNTANNSAIDTDALTPNTELSITKTDDVTTAVPGTSLTYTIVVSNAGPSDAPDTSIVDNFPAAFTSVNWTATASGGAAGFTANGNSSISATGVHLPAGSSVTYTVTGTINPAATGTLSNTATVSQANDTDASYNSATDSDTLTPQTDVSVTKTDGVTTAVPGTSLTYIIVVSNSGPSTATSTTLTDMLPAALTGVTWTSLAAGGATGNTASSSGNISQSLTLPPGSTVTYTVTGTISPAATGTLSNTATVSQASDTDTSNNSATDSDTLTPQTDVSVTKTDGVTTAVPGTSLTYTIVVSNSGPSTATSTTLTDTLSAALTGVTWTSVAAGGATGSTASSSGNISQSLTLPPGSTVTYAVTGTINPAATGTLANTATVSQANDTNTGNNSATDSDTLAPQTDVAVNKTDGVTTAVPGTSLTYTIVVSNSGPSTATSTALTDTLPAALTGVTWTSVAAGGATGNTASSSGNISQSFNLPPGATVTYTVIGTVSASATGTLANTATVSQANDTNAANNSATDIDTLAPTANLSITKTDGIVTYAPATSTTYTIVVANAGPSQATGATLTDTLPAGIASGTWTASYSSGASGPVSGSGNISALLNLAPGASATFTVNANISFTATGDLTNTATIAAPVGVTDPTLSNNSATDTDTLNPFLVYDNTLAPVSHIVVMLDATATKLQFRRDTNAGSILYETLLAPLQSLKIVGGNGSETVTIDDVNGLPSFLGSVPAVAGLGDNPALSDNDGSPAPEFFFEGGGGTNTLNFNLSRAGTAQQYALGTGSGPGTGDGEVQTTNPTAGLNVYFHNVAQVNRTGQGTSPGELRVFGDNLANRFAIAASGASTSIAASGYVPFSFSGNNYSSLVVLGQGASDALDLQSLGFGQSAALPITLDGGAGGDLLKVRSTSGNAGPVSLLGQAGDDLFLLSNSSANAYFPAGPNVAGSVDLIQALVSVNGGVATDTDTLVVDDSQGNLGGTVTITKSTLDGLTPVVGSDVTYANIDVLDVSADAGANTLNYDLLSGSTPDLETVRLRGSAGQDTFLPMAANQGTAINPLSDLSLLELIGGAGNDTFGGSNLEQRLRPDQGVLGGTKLNILGDDYTSLPFAASALSGNAASGDKLRLDLSQAAATVIADTVAGRVVSASHRPLDFTGLEQLELWDGTSYAGAGLLATQLGDLYLRLSDAAETVQLAQSSAVATALQVTVDSTPAYGPFQPLRRVQVFARGGADNVSLAAAAPGNLLYELRGEAGDDTLTGGPLGDLLVGGPGKDNLDGKGGNNLLWGDDEVTTAGTSTPLQGLTNPSTTIGNVLPLGSRDVAQAGDGDDILKAEGGNDTYFGGGGNDTISDTGGANYLNGGAGDDKLTGGPGPDLLRGGLGVDNLQGGGGNDALSGGDGLDTLDGGAGLDVVLAGRVNDNLNDSDAEPDLLVADLTPYDVDSGAYANGVGGNAAFANTLELRSANDLALLAILQQWQTGSTAALVAANRTTIGTGVNLMPLTPIGTAPLSAPVNFGNLPLRGQLLAGSTVTADGQVDILTGNAQAPDWVLAQTGGPVGQKPLGYPTKDKLTGFSTTDGDLIDPT